ncbi:MAG: hypothetical protein CFE22_18070 [Cytophagaceae bacterium BCCC1]|nr:MAG: hypothetical protein CFE22_18070 [Cytophagaceae bacterium BCCC1]
MRTHLSPTGNQGFTTGVATSIRKIIKEKSKRKPSPRDCFDILLIITKGDTAYTNYLENKTIISRFAHHN